MKSLLLISTVLFFCFVTQAQSDDKIFIQYNLKNTLDIELIKKTIIDNTIIDSVERHFLCTILHDVVNQNEAFFDENTDTFIYKIKFDSIKKNPSNYYYLIDVSVQGLLENKTFYPNTLLFTTSYYDEFSKKTVTSENISFKFGNNNKRDVFTKTIVCSNFTSKTLFDNIPKRSDFINNTFLSNNLSLTNVTPYYGEKEVYLVNVDSQIVENKLTHPQFEEYVSTINLKPEKLRWYSVIDYFFAKKFHIKDSIIIQEKMKKIKQRKVVSTTPKHYHLEKATVSYPWQDPTFYSIGISSLLNTFYNKEYQNCITKYSEHNKAKSYSQFYLEVISDELYTNGAHTTSKPIKVRIFVTADDPKNIMGIDIPITEIPYGAFVKQINSLNINELKSVSTLPTYYWEYRQQYWVTKPYIIAK